MRFPGGRWRGAFAQGAASPQFVSTVTVAFLFMLGYGLVGPLLPVVVDEFGVSRAGTGLLLSSFALGRLGFDVIAGVLGDRFGIRSMAIVACVVTLAASLVAAFTAHYGVLLGARVVQGMGSALYMTVAMGAVLALAPSNQVGKFLSLYQGAVLVGITAGPLVGGAAAAWWGIRGVFLTYGVFALVSIVPSMSWLPGRVVAAERQVAGEAETSTGRGSLRALLLDPAFMIVLATGFVVFWLRSGVGNTVLPLLAAERFAFGEIAVGLLLTAGAGANFVVLFHAGRSVDRSGRRAVLLRSMAVLTLTIALFPALGAAWMLFAASAVIGGLKAYANVVPGAVLADLADPRIRNTGVGVLRMTTDLGLLVGPVTAGALVDALGYDNSFLLAALVAGGLTAAVLMMRETGRTRTAEEPR